jgi:hypothetical protein
MMGLMQKSPAMQVTATGYKLKSDLQDLSQQYNTPGLDPAVKAQLKQTMDAKIDKLQQLDQFIMDVKEPDPVKVETEARKSWSENTNDMQKNYKNYDDYLQQFSDSLNKTRSAFHGDLDNIKFKIAYGVNIRDAQQQIDTNMKYLKANVNPKLYAQIDKGNENRLKKDQNLPDALDYTTQWVNSIKTKNPAPTPSLSSASSGQNFDQQVDQARKNNQANTSAMGVNLNLRNIAERVGLINDPQTQLAALERDHNAGIYTDATYNKIKNDILVRQAARQ